MATPAQSLVTGNQRPAIVVKPATDPTSCPVTLNVFDGSRQLIDRSVSILITVTNGAQEQLYKDYVNGPTILLQLPIYNNFSDNYSIVAYASGYEQAGFQPVKVGPNAPQTLDLMLLSKDAGFNFANAKWADLVAKRPQVAKLLSASTSDPATAYSQLMEEPGARRLACLLNITTAMQQILLPTRSPLDYFKTFDLDALQPDRIFGYADVSLVDQVRAAAQQGKFDTQPSIDLMLHGDATSSYKQNQFGEANVQLTFHEHNTKVIDGVNCCYVEPDIDYYKDPAAHLILEVIPHGLTGTLSDPRVVYVLRWIAGQHAGISNFDPLYTIV